MKNLPPWLNDVWQMMINKLPTIGIAFAILIGGWIIAYILQKIVFGLLKRTDIDDKIARALGMETGGEFGDRVETAIAKLVYYIALGMVLVAFFGYLKIDAVTRPLITVLDGFAGAVPNLLKAILIGMLGFVVATGIRRLLLKLFDKIGFEKRVAELTGDHPEKAISDEDTDEAKSKTKKKRKKKDADGPQPVGETIAGVAYWFIIVVTAIPVLEALKIGALANPLSSMFSTITNYLPKVAAAVVLLLAGYLVARVVRTVVAGVLSKVGVDRAMNRIGFGKITKEQPLSGILGTIAMAFVLLHFAISAVGRLQIDEISVPLRTMLEQIYSYLPKLLVGAVLMAVGVMIARIAGNVASRLLAAMGFNTLMGHIGLFEQTDAAKAQEEESKKLIEARRAAAGDDADDEDDDAEDELLAGHGSEGISTPSDVAGVVVGAVIVLLFLRQVLGTMHLEGLANLLDGLLAYLPNVAVALVVVGAGLWAGQWAHKRLDELTSKSSDRLLKAVGNIAHIAIVAVTVMIALQQLGVGRQLIAIAFALILGSVCLALALAFGLGGRDVAGKIVEKEYNRRNR